MAPARRACSRPSSCSAVAARSARARCVASCNTAARASRCSARSTSTGRTRRLGVAYRAGRLEKKIDGEPPTGMAQLAALLPVHAIDPSMHGLVEGGPSERRRFLDWGVFHVEPGYLDAWKTLPPRAEPAKRGPEAGRKPSRSCDRGRRSGGGRRDRRREPTAVSRHDWRRSSARFGAAAARPAVDARLPARAGSATSASKTRWPRPSRVIGRAAARSWGPIARRSCCASTSAACRTRRRAASKS